MWVEDCIFIVWVKRINRGQGLFHRTCFLLIRYTYGQPVPGKAEVELCRPLQLNSGYGLSLSWLVTPEHPEGIPELYCIVPCHKESKQVT